MNNAILFDFQGEPPAPFDTLDSPRLTEPQYLSVYNGYGEKQVSTLSPALISAIHVYLDLKKAAVNGGVGKSDQCTFAEYQSAAGEIRLAKYNKIKGVLSYGIYKQGALFPCLEETFDPLVLCLALLPPLLDDHEFCTKFEAYERLYAKNEKLDRLLSPMSVLCDNAYRRITQTKCPNHLPVNLFPSLGRFSSTIKDSNITRVYTGQLRVFGADNPASSAKSKERTLSELQTSYAMNPSRVLTPKEQSLIPTIPAYFDIPDQAGFICQHIVGTTNSQTPIRNVMLRGKSGTGKTGIARLIAAILGRPYLLFTCSSDTEAMDLVGQPVPAGMIAAKEAPSLLPSYDMMVYDPANAYLALTGQQNSQATTQQCIAAYMQRVQQETASQPSAGFVYSSSDLITALKNGYVVEIQEVASIQKPGVLVSLNSLLEQNGSIRLLTGERIVRHPEAVVVMTTNVDYEGLEAINQSVLDRMDLIVDLPDPPQKKLIQRLKAATGFQDEAVLAKMVEVAEKIEEYCRVHALTDGVCGFRSLLSWAASAKLTGDVYRSALHTIVSKATNETDEQDKIIDEILIQYFSETPSIAV